MDADIRLVLKSRGSRATLAASCISAANAELARMQLEYPDAPGELPLHLITRRLNEMRGEDGI